MRATHRTAPAFVLGAAVSVQIGAAIAKSLFAELGPPAVVLLRLVFGAAAVWALQRPQLRGRSRAELLPVLALGVTLVCMNISFYEAIDRVPLGIGVTVEFIGPLALAVISTRRRLDFVWVVLAAAGILLLSGGGGSTADPLGIFLAALAGVFWATYIVLGTRVGRAWSGSSGLAVAMAVGAALAIAPGVAAGGRGLLDPLHLLAGAGVGLLCSALPWSLEIEAMRRLPTHVFGVLMSVEPAVAALSGLILLGEHLRTRAVVAIGLVVVASAGAALVARDPEVPFDP